MIPTLPTLAVSLIYCLWHAWYQARLLRERKIRERVAYMLWVSARQLD
ncbi:MAG TPA: hypothetical protein VFE78_20675 [Gemmataceae bacterium]|jgi:hypothetical protein|nr:hypothetical protein [Gemmataceae bacterium]